MCDVGMIERGQPLRFALESCESFRIASGKFRQNLDGDVAIQPWIVRSIDLAHPAGAERRDDLVRTDLHSGREGLELVDGSTVARAWASTADS
jgi:hypothetical protein